MKYKKIILIIGLLTTSYLSYAKTNIEFAVAVTDINLNITELRQSQPDDNQTTVNFGLGAYRWITESSAWGAVIDYSTPISRNDDFSGDGRILALRPVNWRYRWTNNFTSELFLGAAKYNSRKSAIGYYAGVELSYSPKLSDFRIGLQYKHYQDLTYDVSGGDFFANGSSIGLVLGYSF